MTVSVEFPSLNLSLLQEGATGDNMWEALPFASQITRRQTENNSYCCSLSACLPACLFITVYMLHFHSPGMLAVLIALELHSLVHVIVFHSRPECLWHVTCLTIITPQCPRSCVSALYSPSSLHPPPSFFRYHLPIRTYSYLRPSAFFCQFTFRFNSFSRFVLIIIIISSH